jgi:hypothetical protein
MILYMMFIQVLFSSLNQNTLHKMDAWAEESSLAPTAVLAQTPGKTQSGLAIGH